MLAPSDAEAPFAEQGMQVILDRLGTSGSANYWAKNPALLKRGVLVSAGSWMKHTKHQLAMTNKILPVADRRGDKSLLFHICFERPLNIPGADLKWLPRSGIIVASKAQICEFVQFLLRNPTIIRGFDIRNNGKHIHVHTQTHT